MSEWKIAFKSLYIAAFFLILAANSHGKLFYNISLNGKAIGILQIGSENVFGNIGKKENDEVKKIQETTGEVVFLSEYVPQSLIKEQGWQWQTDDNPEKAVLISSDNQTIEQTEYQYYFNQKFAHLGDMLDLNVKDLPTEAITLRSKGLIFPKWSCFKIITIGEVGKHSAHIVMCDGDWQGRGTIKPDISWRAAVAVTDKREHVADPIFCLALHATSPLPIATGELFAFGWGTEGQAVSVSIASAFKPGGTKSHGTIQLGDRYSFDIVSIPKTQVQSPQHTQRGHRSGSMRVSKDVMQSCQATYNNQYGSRKLVYDKASGLSPNFRDLVSSKKEYSQPAVELIPVPLPPVDDSLPACAPPSPPHSEEVDSQINTTTCCTIL